MKQKYRPPAAGHRLRAKRMANARGIHFQVRLGSTGAIKVSSDKGGLALKTLAKNNGVVELNNGVVELVLGTDEITSAFREAVKQTIEEKQKKGLPVAMYDVETKRAYLENADGTREYV